MPLPRLSGKTIAAITAAVGIAATSLIIPHEGKKNEAYYDPPKIATICYGHTKGVKIGDKATDVECNGYLKEDLRHSNEAVLRLVKVPLNDHVQAAMISFVFNVGEGAFARSTMLKYLNQGRIKEACNELPKWVYATVNGKRVVLKGLVKRRAAEREVCLTYYGGTL